MACKGASRVRVGVVGPGTIWEKIHLPILQGSTFWQIAGFCARREEHAADLALRFPGAFVTTDLDALLARPEIDAVVVTTPLTHNAPVTLQALAAGKHVLVEKPLAVRRNEVAAILQAQQASGKSVYVLEQQLYHPQIDILRKLLTSGRLGEPVTFECLAFYRMDEEADTALGYEKASWRREADFPLGHIWDGGVHQISVFNALFGLPRSIFAKGSPLRQGMGRYHHILALLDYGEGFRASFSHSALLGGSGSRFDIHCRQGSVYIRDDALVLEDRRTGGQERIALPQQDLYRKMWSDIEALIKTGGAPPFTPADAGGCVAFLEAVEASIRTGADARLQPFPSPNL